MRAIVLLLALAVATTPVWPAETPSPGDEAEPPAAAGDLAGCRVCPQCQTVNPPEALYCMACGAALGPQEEATWPRTPATLAPELFIYGSSLTAGFVVAHDRGSWGNEFAMVALYDFCDLQGGALADNIYFYFSERRLRPYIAVEPYFAYTDSDDASGRLALGGGVLYGFGRYGSYVYAGVSAGAHFHDGGVSPFAVIHARLLYFFTPHVGISGGLGSPILRSAISFGPSFAF